jgi:hypothetical protein
MNKSKVQRATLTQTVNCQNIPDAMVRRVACPDVRWVQLEQSEAGGGGRVKKQKQNIQKKR